MTANKDDRGYPAVSNETGYCPWCDEDCLLTVKGSYNELQKYLCEQCGETFYI